MYRLPSYLINTLCNGTVVRINKDVQNLRERVLASTNDPALWDLLWQYPNQLEKLPEEFQQEYSELSELSHQAKDYLTKLTTSLALLMTKANIKFQDEYLVGYAFIKCLPEYFHQPDFLKSIKNNLNEDYVPTELLDLIESKPIECDEFISKHKINQETEEQLMFFVGTQLINDIF